jgi:predicted dehydrogenase
MEATLMKFAVIGHGSIGRRHAANARLLGIDVVTVDPVAPADVTTIDEAGAVDAVLVCTPAQSQVQTALGAINERRPVFVEKPCGDTAMSASWLLGAAVPVQVGYNLRFDPSLLNFRMQLPQVGCIRHISITFGQHVSAWRPGRDYRQTPAVDGILLEASHEIDLINWLFGPVRDVIGVGLDSGLEGIREDSASALLQMASGPSLALHLDMLRAEYKREIEVIGESGTAIWSPSWLDGAEIDPIGVNAMYLAELASFINTVRTGAKPSVGVPEAVATHELIEAIRGVASETFLLPSTKGMN